MKFGLLIIGDNWEEQLEPYMDNNDDDCDFKLDNYSEEVEQFNLEELQDLNKFATCAVLKDGVWHEPSKDIWSHSVLDKKKIKEQSKTEKEWSIEYANLIKDVKPTEKLKIIICHW